MDLSSAQQNTPSSFASQVLTWLKWRYSPIAEIHASTDAENAIKNLNFPSVAHFLRPFFTFTEPVSVRGVNETAMQPNSLHLRLYPLERVRETDAGIRTAYFAKSLAEEGEKEFASFEKNLFPILRKVASQGANDDDRSSSEVPLHHLLQKDISHSAQVRDSLMKSQQAIEDAEAAGLDPSTISQPPLEAPKNTPGHGVTSSFSSSMPSSFDKANSSFIKTAETLLKASYQQWFANFVRDYHAAVRFSAFDPVDYPVAQVFVVTSSFLNQPGHPDCDVVRACQKMLEQSRSATAPAVSSNSNQNNTWPNWTSISVDRTNVCRIVFILHDPKSDITDKTVDSVRGRIASEICNPAGGCYVLKIPDLRKRTRESLKPLPDERVTIRPWLNANSLYGFDDYAAAIEKVQRQLENENLVTADTSLEAAIAKVDSSTSLASLAPFNNILVNKNDYDEISRNVNNALRLSIFPFIDRRLRSMASYVSENRQSALGKFASSLFSSDKNKQPSIIKDRYNSDQPRYRFDCLEMQMRRCGDFCMAIQDYTSALNYYRMCRDEWKESLPSREFNRPLIGAAKEAIAVCMYLTGKIILPPNQLELRRDPDSGRFEQARDEYRSSKCANYTFRVTTVLIQMCRESKNPSHDRGILQIVPGAQISQMTTLYQAIMFEQLALFRLVSSPPIPILAATKKWLTTYLADGATNASLLSLSSRPRSFALAMYEAAKRFHECNNGGLGRHSLRCALAAWHVLRYRIGRNGSFPLLLADVALFIAKRFVIDSEPLQAAGFISFALHSTGWTNLPTSVQQYAVKLLKECVVRASQRFGTTAAPLLKGKSSSSESSRRRHVLIHSTVPRFAYSLISVSSNGILQDPQTQTLLDSSSSFTIKNDLEVECERLYDDIRSEYSDASSILNVPRNLHHYKNSFSKPHSERKLGLSHQKHHHDDLYVPKPSETQPPSLFYTTSENESLDITIGVRYRFPCVLRKVRLLYVELNQSDRDNNSVFESANATDSAAAAAQKTTSSSLNNDLFASSSLANSGGVNSSSTIPDLLIGAGSRKIAHEDILVASTGIDQVILTGDDQDVASVCSLKLPISFDKRGTFAVVGFRYEAELSGGTSFISPAGPVLHNCLFPCLQLSHQLYHESPYLDNITTSPQMMTQSSTMHLCVEELMMNHAQMIFNTGIPVTHPSYLYVHVRAPTPKLTMEFCPPLPSACRNGELFSTQLVVKNVSPSVEAEHARIYISECCGHMFALDARPNVSGLSQKATAKALAEWKSTPSNDAEETCEWTRFVASDEHPRQNVGGLIRITIPKINPEETFTFNCVFRAQGNDFLKNRVEDNNKNNNNNSSRKKISSATNNNNSNDVNDLTSVVLFSSWTVPKSYLAPKDAPAVAGAFIRCGRLYRRMIVLPSISITPKCVSLVTTKPLQKITDGKKTTGDDNNNSKKSSSDHHLPRVALAIDVRSEKKQLCSSNSSKTVSAAPTSDTFFVVDDISIVTSGWDVKCLSVPTSGEGSPSRHKNQNHQQQKQRASLSSRSVTSTTNWTCAAMLTRDTSTMKLWDETDLVPNVQLTSLDEADDLDDDDDTTTSSSSSSSDDDNTSTSDSSDDDKKEELKKLQRQNRKQERKNRRPKKSHLKPSFASLLHFCMHAPLCGTGVLGRPAIIADGLAFYQDGNEKKDKNKDKKKQQQLQSDESSPATVQTPQTKSSTSKQAQSSDKNDNAGSFPLRSPSYERELVCLPDQFSPNEKCPLLLRVNWREVSRKQNFDNSKQYKTLRRGVSFDVVRIGNGDLHGVEALFNFRQRLFDEATFRRENDGQTAPLSPLLKIVGKALSSSSSAATGHEIFVETKLLKESLRDDNPLSIPKIQCALSAPRDRVFSSFSESGFTAEVPIEIAISNQSPFPVLVSVFATPRYSGNGTGLPVIFSGRHAFTDIYLKPAETVSHLKFVALALGLGILDVASSCFTFEVVNALVSKSTRGSGANQQSTRFSSQGSGALLVTSSGPAISSYTSKATALALRAKAAAVKDAPAPIIVFGNVAGVAHSSLVRVEALRVRPPVSGNEHETKTGEQQKNQSTELDSTKSIFDLSFAGNAVAVAQSSVAIVDTQSVTSSSAVLKDDSSITTTTTTTSKTKTVGITEPAPSGSDDNSTSSIQQQQDGTSTPVPTAAVPVRRRGERSSSRVCRSSDGSTYIPIKIEGVSLTNPSAATSENNATSSENVSSENAKSTTSPSVHHQRSHSDGVAKEIISSTTKQTSSPTTTVSTTLHQDPVLATNDNNQNNNSNPGDDDVSSENNNKNIIEPTTDKLEQQASVIVVPTYQEQPEEPVVIPPEEPKPRSRTPDPRIEDQTATNAQQQINHQNSNKSSLPVSPTRAAATTSNFDSSQLDATLNSATATVSNLPKETTVKSKEKQSSSKILKNEGIRTSDIADFVSAGAPAKKKKNRFESSSDDDDDESTSTTTSASETSDKLNATQKPRTNSNSLGGSKQSSMNASTRISGRATPMTSQHNRTSSKTKNVFESSSSSSSDDDDNKKINNNKKVSLSPRSPASGSHNASKIHSKTASTEASFPKGGGRFGSSSSDDDEG